eukprot:NODE_38_length_30618_cov_0.377142.p13 type:complete len:216 gc:universal NODE_38_length_30618_cov_0.377142:19268-18621(-)
MRVCKLLVISSNITFCFEIIFIQMVSFQKHLQEGDIVPIDSITTISDAKIDLKGSNGLIHLSLRRFSGCPICNLKMVAISTHLKDLKDALIREVIVLHSEKKVIQENQGKATWSAGLEFVADPSKQIYKAFGCKNGSMIKMMKFSVIKAIIAGKKITKQFSNPKKEEGGSKLLPMDAIIDCSNGKIVKIYYGKNAGDQWTVDEILKNAKTVIDSN